MAVECLEARQMLSAINWTNRGLSTDRFDSTFGANAAVARNVVDAAIDAWERVFVDFNQPGGGNTINVNISMESSGTGFGATASVTSQSGGYPTAGTIRFGRGNDTNSDGVGDGAGYFLDPTPEDHSEFTGSILHAFTGDATPGGPAAGKPDLFTLAVHELTHILGIIAVATLKLHNPLSGSVTNTGITDESEGSGIGRYFVFDGPSVTHLMTSNNGGSGGSDASRIVHSAGPDNGDPNQPVTFNSAFRGTRELVGAQDVSNALYEFGRRYLPADYISLVLCDAYGYETTPPQTFGTFYAMLKEDTGELLVRGRTGPGTSSDEVHVSRVGSNLRVSIDIGVDTPGTGPNGDDSDIAAFVTEFPLAEISSITVQGFDGDDLLILDFSGGDPLPPGGLSYDGGFGLSNTLHVDLANTFQASHTGTPDGTMTIDGIGEVVTYSDIQSIIVVNGAVVDPEGLVVAPAVIEEGQSALLDLTFAPGVGDHLVTVDWGDGQVESFPLSDGTAQLTGVPHSYLDDEPSGTSQDDYTISVTVVDSGEHSVFSDTATVTVQNVAPELTALSLNPSTVTAGGQATLQGAYSDSSALDVHTLDVDLDGDGTFDALDIPLEGGAFSLDFTFAGPAGTHSVNVRLRDDDGGAAVETVMVTVADDFSEVLDMRLFYNNSAFDGNGAAVDADDFSAIATDKVPLTFGNTGTFRNISGYSRGINGVFIDVAPLPADGNDIDAADFAFLVGNDDSPDQWALGPAPASVGVLAGLGTEGADRIFITFADGVIADTWLRVTILANPDTGLAAPADFFFGSAPGETGASFSSDIVSVDAADLQSIAQNFTQLANIGNEPISNVHDLNHDGSVNAFDLQVTGQNFGFNLIDLISPQAGGSAAAAPGDWQEPLETESIGASARDMAAKDVAFALASERRETFSGPEVRVAHAKRAVRERLFASFDKANGSVLLAGMTQGLKTSASPPHSFSKT